MFPAIEREENHTLRFVDCILSTSSGESIRKRFKTHTLRKYHKAPGTELNLKETTSMPIKAVNK